jgi:hypothetical protein
MQQGSARPWAVKYISDHGLYRDDLDGRRVNQDEVCAHA